MVTETRVDTAWPAMAVAMGVVVSVVQASTVNAGL
jgi:hypothetical protein